MEEQVRVQVKGHVTISEVDSGKVLYDDHNALTANAPNIIRNALGGGIPISEIIALKAAVVLAVSPVSTVTYTSTNEVTFRSVFTPASFNDTLDELQLGNPAFGLFSTVTALSIFKDGATQIAVEWKLEIIT